MVQAAQQSSSQLLYQQALALHQRGNVSGAVAAYQDLLRVEPSHPHALHHLAVLYWQGGDPKRHYRSRARR